MPGFIKPQLATLKMKAPSEGYFHEIKYDGYRAQVHVDKGSLRPRGGDMFGKFGDWLRQTAFFSTAIDIARQTLPESALIGLRTQMVRNLRDTPSEVFAEIYRRNIWGYKETASGGGSTLHNTQRVCEPSLYLPSGSRSRRSRPLWWPWSLGTSRGEANRFAYGAVYRIAKLIPAGALVCRALA
jgi:hypothetical protein